MPIERSDRARGRRATVGPPRPPPSPPRAGAGSAVGGLAPAVPSMRAMARFTMPESLPEGEAKVAAVRGMFDAIAPRYDLVNRIMTFRMDVRWRRRTRRAARPWAPGRRVVDLACGTGDLCRELTAQDLRSDRRRPVLRHARRRPHRGTARSGRRPAPARSRMRRSTASPAGSRCATSRAFRRSSLSWPGWCAPVVASRCSRWPTPPNRLLRFGHGIYFGKVVPAGGWPALGSSGLPLPAALGGLPARAGRDARRSWPTAGFERRRPTPPVGRASHS